jgi:hypothetical protein
MTNEIAENVDSKSRIIQVCVSTETPAKNCVFDGGVASFRAEKLALSLRTRRDGFKLTASELWVTRRTQTYGGRGRR